MATPSAGTRRPVDVVALIGRGDMGEVYRARSGSIATPPLKILSDLFATDLERLARFEREAKTLATLNHPNIADTAVPDLPAEAGDHETELGRAVHLRRDAERDIGCPRSLKSPGAFRVTCAGIGSAAG